MPRRRVGHPSQAEAWDWDAGNEAELAAHGIRPEEVQEVWASGARFAPNKRHRPGDWKMMGLTTAGRRLSIVVRYDSGRRTLRPITGWDATDGERTKYF